MRHLAVVLVVAWAASSHAQVVEKGDYVVVRGALAACTCWSDRVIDVARIDGYGAVEVLGREIPALGEAYDAMRQGILEAIAEHTGAAPKSLTVEILKPDQYGSDLMGDFAMSRRHPLAWCPSGNVIRESSGSPSDADAESIRRLELADAGA